ncbi:PLP-dependent cysteine synthase family protein [Stackebrandtia nassauensis]|uniref:L-cysteine desulfhydrase Cds1 n=1 Tax=Stackebrandtia nassauensis (strain DSM 44728 / CIP 108903 / NRRL B-16338 / NBRC 102104 / LLR-40K-21) TaxID=446470 RepID=D3Q824_STANL|nr:PLP-dependent cysteine synthase family protein [Stackebrandtia nassauensis]ADD40529.1 Pyridoxal-5'-phosphate-dependent protein beta subunit [Stackebrandtia nassauensis DSM 44728]
MDSLDRCCDKTRAWVNEAIAAVAADANRSADTHLLPFPLFGDFGVDLYLKDESVHPTGSLKHRLARSLFLYALCNGWITEGTPIIEASSGSTAVSEAYFARMLGLPFIAVMPASTSREKISLIEFTGGSCHLVDDPTQVVATARALAAQQGGHYMDQFTYAERATDWRGNNNIAESIYQQMAAEPHPIPAWVVVGAGTGGTSATIGRYIRYQRHSTKLCVVDPENSAFFSGWRDNDESAYVCGGSRIEGIGRPHVEPSFLPSVVDRMVKVPDAASIAIAREASKLLGRKVGGSTGTNLYAAFALIAEMRQRGETGSVVTLLCDSGDRYVHSYFDDAWVAGQGLDLRPHTETVTEFFASGRWTV